MTTTMTITTTSANYYVRRNKDNVNVVTEKTHTRARRGGSAARFPTVLYTRSIAKEELFQRLGSTGRRRTTGQILFSFLSPLFPPTDVRPPSLSIRHCPSHSDSLPRENTQPDHTIVSRCTRFIDTNRCFAFSSLSPSLSVFFYWQGKCAGRKNRQSRRLRKRDNKKRIDKMKQRTRVVCMYVHTIIIIIK